MTYTPTSRAVLDLDEDDSAKPDKDVKPHIHKSRTTGGAIQVPSLAARMGMTADDLHAANGNDEDEEDDAELDEDEDEDGEWTTRSAAAKALASAAESFEGALLEILLPQVTQMLSQGDWYQREAAIFALGNVAIGCLEAMHDHLPSLVPFLLDSLRDQHVSLNRSF
jgi:transportin-1